MSPFVCELPKNYREVYHIDAGAKKTGLLLTLFSLVISVAVIVSVVLLCDFSTFNRGRMFLYDLVFLGGMIAYIVSHELVHGAAYKALTHQKLTFGITWSAAFCGVPDIYVSRRTALIALAMPLAVFSLVFLTLTLTLARVDAGWYLVCGVLLGIHLGGCIGDMFMIWLLLTKYKSRALLMRDTGPEQFLYMPEE